MRSLSPLTLAFLFAPCVALADTPPATGTVNYFEGTASLAGHPLSPTASGRATLAAGQQLSTSVGKVELVLAPDVVLRVDENSAIRLDANDPNHIELTLERGSATVEVARLSKQRSILINQSDASAPAQTRVDRPGLYEFTASPHSAYGNLGSSPDLSVRVLAGRASTRLASGQQATVKEGHVLDLAANSTHTAKFNRDDFSDPITDWSTLRDDYLSSTVSVQNEANGSGYGAAPTSAFVGNYGGYGGYGGFGPVSTGFFGFGGYPFFGSGWLGSGFYGLGGPFGFGSPYGFGYPFGYGFYGGYPYGGGFYGGGYPSGYHGGGGGIVLRRPGNGFTNVGPRPPLRPPILLRNSGSRASAPSPGFHNSAPAPSFHNSAPAPSFHGGGAPAGGGGGGHR